MKRGVVRGGGLPPPPRRRKTSSASTSRSTAAPPGAPTQWGLDPLYWSYVRLLAVHVHALRTAPGIETSHILGGHALSRVEMVGVIVRMIELEHMTKFTLDDGTGLVDCTKWNQRGIATVPVHQTSDGGIGSSGNAPPTTLYAIMAEADRATRLRLGRSSPSSTSSSSLSRSSADETAVATSTLYVPTASPFQLGDTVRVRGKFRKVPAMYLERYTCCSETEISVHSMVLAEHPHEALHHRLTSIALSLERYGMGVKANAAAAAVAASS